ncbi:uncharacterized protein LOC120291178 [Eucalyptus grandis]|uniref:uncharacterized protein LOC120291178 n=1 Tax=Eucalyptus grandis TaxID=71139 RepID=UPI00192E9AEE|nr:uncharacterized protein LOC120291178 [Eucalyptus grandis]
MRPIQAKVQENRQLPPRNFLGPAQKEAPLNTSTSAMRQPSWEKMNAELSPSSEVLQLVASSIGPGQQLALFLPAKSLDVPRSDVSSMKHSLDLTRNSELNHAGGKEQSHPVDGLAAYPQKLASLKMGILSVRLGRLFLGLIILMQKKSRLRRLFWVIPRVKLICKFKAGE